MLHSQSKSSLGLTSYFLEFGYNSSSPSIRQNPRASLAWLARSRRALAGGELRLVACRLMKVFIHYEEPAAAALHQTLKITLPKKWVTGPVENLIRTFLEQYNAKHPQNALKAENVHFENDNREHIPYEALVIDKLSDRSDLYVKYGTSARPTQVLSNTGVVSTDYGDGIMMCKRFGCGKKYADHENVDGCCSYHVKPPIFHETSKYWSCCPTKKCYDWESFMEIKGCSVGQHTNIKPETVALGGCDVRDARAGGPALKTVEAFNKEISGADGETLLKHTEAVMTQLGVDKGMFRSAVEKLKKDHKGDLKAVQEDLAFEFSQALNNVVGVGGGPPAFGTGDVL
jgi:hypothetical protein